MAIAVKLSFLDICRGPAYASTVKTILKINNKDN